MSVSAIALQLIIIELCVVTCFRGVMFTLLRVSLVRFIISALSQLG